MSAAALKAGDTGRARDAQRRVMTDAEFDDQILKDMERFYDDPIGFVYYAFPWGYGELADADGPDTWQLEFLEDLARIGSVVQATHQPTLVQVERHQVLAREGAGDVVRLRRAQH